MNKTHRLIYLTFICYVFYTQVLLGEYEEMNDKLQKAINTLLSSCISNKNENLETEKYE